MTTKQSEATQKVAVRSFRKGGKAGLFDKLDLKRILAMSAVMVMHTTAIGLMLLPAVPIAAIALPPPEPAWVDVTEPPPPPPPLPPEPVRPVVPPVVKVQPIISTPPPVAPALEAPDLIATTREPSPEVGTMSPTIVEPPAAVGGTVSESILKVLHAPPPQFPQALIRAGFSGTVEFSVLVGVDGIAQDIRLMKSSGNRRLDQSTLSHIKRQWRFKAPEIDGQAVPGWGRGKIAFTLEA